MTHLTDGKLVDAEKASIWIQEGCVGWQSDIMWDAQRETTFQHAMIYRLAGAPEDVSRAEKIIPSRRWEARREGVEDDAYLRMLRELIAEHRDDPGLAKAVEEGQQARDAAVKTVLGHPEQTEQADRQREKVLEAIGNLHQTESTSEP